MVNGTPETVEHGASRQGSWLQTRRVRIAAWIAAAEVLIVLFSSRLSQWTVIGLAIIAVLCWYAGRESRSHTVRQVVWIFAASQLFAVIAVMFSFFIRWALIIGVVGFAVVGLLYLFRDRG